MGPYIDYIAEMAFVYCCRIGIGLCYCCFFQFRMSSLPGNCSAGFRMFLYRLLEIGSSVATGPP